MPSIPASRSGTGSARGPASRLPIAPPCANRSSGSPYCCGVPAITVADRTLRRVMGFVTDPASPAYGRYPNQAGFAAYSLLEEVAALSPHLEV